MSAANELFTVRFDTGSPHEVTEDFTIPDYMPEVRRIVSCSAAPIPENKYIEGNEVVLSGIVNFTVLYIGEDGKLSAVPLSSEYTAKIQCGTADMSGLSRDGIVSSTSVTSSSCRAVGPRKLSLGCRLYSKLFSVSSRTCRENLTSTEGGKLQQATTADEITLERRKVEVTSASVITASTTGNVTGEVRTRPDAKIISCSSGAGVSDIKTGLRDVTVKGDVYIDFITEDSSGDVTTLRIKNPIEENITVGNTSTADRETKNASAIIRCAGITVSGGDEGVYTWNMEYDIDIICTSKKNVQITDDIYSTKYETDVSKEMLFPLTCLKNGNSRLTVSSDKQTSGGDTKHVGHVAGKVTLDKAECSSDGKLSLSGSCTVYVVAVGGGEISMEEVVIPVKFDCPCEKSNGGKNVICEASVMYADARFDGDRLSVAAELSLSLFAYATVKSEFASECKIDRERTLGKRGSCVKIYFPEEDEDMWDIGKKYHCRVEKITRLAEGGTVILS